MRFQAPIGESDFRKLRRSGLIYVDKTQLIVDLLDDSSAVVLLPRPRRFGKTLNLSTLRYFLERPVSPEDDRTALFEDLAVWRSGAARAHFQRYPVIFLSFKDVKPRTWSECAEELAGLVAETVGQHRWLLNRAELAPDDRADLAALLARQAPQSTQRCALRLLSGLLARATHQPVVILIDEYDTPLHAAWLGGYFDEAVSFFRAFLGAGLKDNPDLFKGVMTGILRIARESLFSDLNNIAVYSLLQPRYAAHFGFTEPEVAALAARAGQADRLPEIRDWYNGYRFADQTIYNPWSVLCFLARPEEGCVPHWVNTSSNELVSRLLASGEPSVSRDLERLLDGLPVAKELEENLILRDLERRPEAIWTLLLFSGYLTATVLARSPRTTAAISVPNREIGTVFTSAFDRWIEQGAGGRDEVRRLCEDLLAGRAREFEGRLQDLVVRSMSYMDPGQRQPERVYHAFVLGLLVHLAPTHRVQSNPEAGYGRADVLVIPRQPGRPGVVMEFKRRERGQTPARALDAALRQIDERDYAATLREAGAAPIQRVAVVFERKKVRVRIVRDPPLCPLDPP